MRLLTVVYEMPRKSKKQNKTHKISKAQFLSVLRENAGLFARTARAIEQQFKVSYTRAAVAQRAKDYPDELLDIDEQNLDIAEEGLHSLMRSRDENVRLRAISLYLNQKGRRRGYGQTADLVVKHTIQPPQIIIEAEAVDVTPVKALPPASKKKK